MEVKKFEAETLRQAIQMVKNELGPDAVILSTKEGVRGYNNKTYVVVTAAISETKLQKKKLAERKLPESVLEKFRSSSATQQKQMIEKMYEVELEKRNLKKSIQPTMSKSSGITKKPYAFIEDEESLQTKTVRTVEFPRIDEKLPSQNSIERIKNAAQEAFKVNVFGGINRPKEDLKIEAEGSHISELRSEIQRLQSMIKTMGAVPQVSQHPGAKYGLPYETSYIFEKLKREGISDTIIVKILKKMVNELTQNEMSKKSILESYIARWVLSDVTVISPSQTERIECFFGPSGSGKTSTLVKIASQYVVKEKKRVAVISTDIYQVGAVEQLKIYCQILNIPFAIVKNSEEFEKVVKQLHAVDKILVDTPGLSLKDVGELNWVRSFVAFKSYPMTKHLVLSALSKDEDLLSIANRFKTAHFTDLIFTGLDQVSRHGQIINLNQMFNSPLHSFGTGKLIPENFEWATKERVLDLLFKLSRISQEGEANGEI